MQTLSLHYDNIIKGRFDLKKLNFLFVFQVNCPGCFIYGIPLVNKLFQEFNQVMSFLGISTAFEDFEFNNLVNTELLINGGEVVGETKKILSHQGLDSYTQPIHFPIAMDKIADASFDFNKVAKNICLTNPNYNIWPKFEQTELQQKIVNYLKNLKLISLTFTLNQFKGTPTILIFNKNYEVLYHQFGHVEYTSVKKYIDHLIEKYN